MTPQQLAMKHWLAFLRDCEPLSATRYRTALEEIQSLADITLMALDEAED